MTKTTFIRTILIRTALGGCLGLVLSLTYGSTLAANSSEPQRSDRSSVIEEVIVTATKREASVQEVPIAVTAISGETLIRAGVTDLRDLSTVATSFNLNSSQTESQGTTLRIRGVGTTGNNIGLESAVGVFLDGVYLSRPGVALGDLMDLESVEVLRGPQGTLFGRNTSAGALNIRTKRPNFQEQEFFGNLTGGNFGLTNVQAGITGPIGESAAYRFSAAVRERDGFLESSTGAESRNRDRYLLRGQLAFDPTDTLSLRVIADYSEADENCCDAVILSQGTAVDIGGYTEARLPADGGVTNFGPTAFDNRRSNAEQFENPNDQWGLSVEANWDISDKAELTYIGAYREFRADSVQHSDFVALDVFSVQPSAAGGLVTFDEIETVTHELRIAGETELVSWLVGGFYSDETIIENQGLGLETDFAANVDANLAFLAANLPALSNIALSTGGTFAGVLAADSRAIAFAGGVNPSGSYAQNVFHQEGKSWSLFTHNSFHITEGLDLVLGLRWTDEEKDGSFTQPFGTNQACLNAIANQRALNAGAAALGDPALATLAGTFGAIHRGYTCFPFAVPADSGLAGTPNTFDNTFSDDELVYTGKAVYQFTETVSGYISFTHGFKAGGFNLDATAAASGGDPRFDSETIDSWELGLKTDLFDRRMRLNLAIFDYDIEDFQVLEFTGVRFATFNVPTAESQGVEIEALALPVEGLELSLNYTYADSNYPSDCDNGDPNAAAQVSSLCGAQFTNAPENVVTGGVSYDGYFGEGLRWFINSNGRWEDDRRTSTQPNLPFDIQESNFKLNARIGIGRQDRSWTAEIWGNNVTDKQTKNVTFNTALRAGSRATFLEAPRTYGLTLRTEL